MKILNLDYEFDEVLKYSLIHLYKLKQNEKNNNTQKIIIINNS